jgi:hypothetical protein
MVDKDMAEIKALSQSKPCIRALRLSLFICAILDSHSVRTSLPHQDMSIPRHSGYHQVERYRQRGGSTSVQPKGDEEVIE